MYKATAVSQYFRCFKIGLGDNFVLPANVYPFLIAFGLADLKFCFYA